jgi:hypothetical protein
MPDPTKNVPDPLSGYSVRLSEIFGTHILAANIQVTKAMKALAATNNADAERWALAAEFSPSARIKIGHGYTQHHEAAVEAEPDIHQSAADGAVPDNERQTSAPAAAASVWLSSISGFFAAFLSERVSLAP